MPDIGQTEAGDFLVSVQPWGDHYAVLVLERKDEMTFYVDLVNDPRFDWFGWRNKLANFESYLTQDQLIEYNDRVSTTFHKIAMPVQKMTSSSVERLLDLCEKVSKRAKKKR